MSTSFPETQNREWGFFGPISHHADPEHAWDIALAFIAGITGCSPDATRAFLGSRHGRHFADKVSDDLSPENILRQAANLKDLYSGILFPWILINTSPTHLRPIRQMQPTRWTGEFWQVFGDQIEAA